MLHFLFSVVAASVCVCVYVPVHARTCVCLCACSTSVFVFEVRSCRWCEVAADGFLNLTAFLLCKSAFLWDTHLFVCVCACVRVSEWVRLCPPFLFFFLLSFCCSCAFWIECVAARKDETLHLETVETGFHVSEVQRRAQRSITEQWWCCIWLLLLLLLLLFTFSSICRRSTSFHRLIPPRCFWVFFPSPLLFLCVISCCRGGRHRRGDGGVRLVEFGCHPVWAADRHGESKKKEEEEKK